MSLRERVQQVFQDRFGAAPTLLVRAPGRVNLTRCRREKRLG